MMNHFGEIIFGAMIVAFADKDAAYLYHALDEVEKFIEELKEELKK